MSYRIYEVTAGVAKKPEFMPSFHKHKTLIILKDVDISLGVAQASNKALLETRELFNEAYDVSITQVIYLGATEEVYGG